MEEARAEEIAKEIKKLRDDAGKAFREAVEREKELLQEYEKLTDQPFDDSEYLYTHDALTVPRGDDAGQLLAPRPQCDADSQLDVAAFRDRGFLILKDAAASDAIARAAAYVATHEACWAPSGTRPDDWRMHRDQRLDAPVADGHLPILDLLREPRLAAAIRCLAGSEGARRVVHPSRPADPAPRKARRRDLPDTSYHIDGEANSSGARFPDVFSLLSRWR